MEKEIIKRMNFRIMKFKIVFVACLLHPWTHLAAQNWSSWINLESDDNNSIQYCYKLYPVTPGNSFSFKIRNNSISNACGEFDVVLNMINGQKKVSCGFKDLKPGVERSCPGVYQFSEVQSFSAVTNVKIGNCGNGTSAQSAPASFTIDYHNEAGKSGKFKYVDPNGQYSFETAAFSGLQKASNNPYSQSFKNQGLIPSGTWKIELIIVPKTKKEKGLNKYPPIFRLTPMNDVELSSLKTDSVRDGFLIHSGRDPLTASQGCIILDNASRQKLKAAIVKYGPINLKVENKIY